jgi:maleylpyruvate isomerase
VKLYSVNLSPFAGRVRLAVYAKGLDVQIERPAEELRSEAFRHKNPLGKLPLLEVAEGRWIPESQTIVEYLEEVEPEPALRPTDPFARARVRLLERVGEAYVLTPLTRLFPHADPRTRDMAVVERELPLVYEGLAALEQLIVGEPYAAGQTFTTADCQLIPTLFYVQIMARALREPELLSRHARTAAYAKASRAHPAVARCLQEMSEAVRVFGETGQIT